jgi:hypothetical protein
LSAFEHAERYKSHARRNFKMTKSASSLVTASDSHAGDVFLLPVALGAFSTLAYQLVLITRWPAQMIVWCFLAMSLAGLFLLLRLWKKTNAVPGRGYRFHPSQILLLLLATACAVTVLFVRRTNQDDIVYFHRALVQLRALGEPIFLRQTTVDMDAAAFSPVHLATSYEMVMALLGHYLGIDPLYFYQVIGHAIAAFSIPLVLYWCARTFGLGRWPATVGALLGILFLLVDSHGPASFGNAAFGRMWQGKVIVWILFVPLLFCLTYRFLRLGNPSDVAWLVLLVIAGTGLSNTALYFAPAIIGCSCASFLALELVDSNRRQSFFTAFRRCMLLALPLVYPVGTLALLKLNIIQKPTDLRGFGPEYLPWVQCVDYVVGTTAEHIRNLALMIVVPLFVIRGNKGRFLFFYIVAVWLFCLNPLMAHWWMKNIFAACYFRLVYLLQLPLLCTLLAAAGSRFMQRGFSLKDRLLTQASVAAIILSFLYSYRTLSIMPRNPKLGIGWKSPRAYQLLPANVDFAKAARKYIKHAKLLAPDWTASCELPLLLPEMKVVAPRLVTHYFANAGNPQEGNLRRQAQAFVEADKSGNVERLHALEPGFRKVIETGRATAVAVPESESDRVLATLKSISPKWHRVLEAGGLVLILPGNTARHSKHSSEGFPPNASNRCDCQRCDTNRFT